MLKAGFAKRCITPSGPMTMAGFDRRTVPAEGRLDDLYVTVLALQSGEEAPFLLCSFDLLGTDTALCQQMQQALPLPSDRVWICATHTHSAPRGAFSGDVSEDRDYIAGLVNGCVAAGVAALEDLAPAEAFWGETAVEGVASLRDVPREQAGYAMPLLSLELRRQRDTLQLVRFTCHPTVLDEGNLLYSRDLPGAMGGEKTLFVNGACADLSTRFTRRASTPEELSRLGARMKAGLEGIDPIGEPSFGTRLHPVSKTLELPWGEGLWGAERFRMLAELEQKAAHCTDAAARRELEACIAVLERGDRAEAVRRRVTVAACHLGSRLLLALPFEVAHGDGAALEAAAVGLAGLPAHLICYCGGYDGYLPHETAGICYQDLATGYPPEVRTMIRQALLDCIEQSMKEEEGNRG